MKLTVIIPTHNRPNLLFRCLNFLERKYGYMSFDLDVIVIDSSRDSKIDINLFPKIRAAIKYFPVSQKMGVFEKLSFATKIMDDGLIQLVADDDLLDLEALDLVARGIVASPSDIALFPTCIVDVSSHRFHMRAPIYCNKGECHSRYEEIGSIYQPTMYNLRQSSVLKKAWELMSKFSFCPNRLKEMLEAYFSWHFSSNFIYVEPLVIVRTSHREQISSNEVLWPEIVDGSDIEEACKIVEECLGKNARVGFLRFLAAYLKNPQRDLPYHSLEQEQVAAKAFEVNQNAVRRLVIETL